MKKINKLSSILLLAVISTSFSLALASQNDLISVDLKKVSDSSIDLNILTKNPYTDEIVVNKKSDNKYIVLLPEVENTNYIKPLINGMKDILSDVNVQSINDADQNYTKITVISKKPIVLTAHAQNKQKVEEFEVQYENILAKIDEPVNIISNSQEDLVPLPKEVAVTQNKVVPKSVVNKVAQSNVSSNSNVKKTYDRSEILQELWLSDLQKVNTENEVAETQIDSIIPVNEDTEPSNEVFVQDVEADINTVEVASVSLKDNILAKLNDIKQNLPIAGLVKIFLTIIPLLAIFILWSVFKALIRNSKNDTFRFKNNLENQPKFLNTTIRKNTVPINETDNWQQKYKKHIGNTAENSAIDANRANLERLVAADKDLASGDVDNLVVEKDIKYFAEENQIKNELLKNVKFKSFEKRLDLNEELSVTNRNRLLDMKKEEVKQQAEQENEIEIVEPSIEIENVNLDKFKLHTNPRVMNDAGMSVANIKSSPYAMSSLNEYFSSLESPPLKKEIKDETKLMSTPMMVKNPIKMSDVSSVNIKNTTNVASTTNVVNNTNVANTESLLDGLVVKSSYKIDDNKNLHLVTLDNKTALIGQVGEEISVLKKFDSDVEKMHVIPDSDGTFMVKAGEFRSMIGLRGNKMGVLLEL
ncbi:MAG: hypothetical protein R3Y28_05550 [Candidatus Gastranaerophilales bacterium]